jgi:hypothetical protein
LVRDALNEAGAYVIRASEFAKVARKFLADGRINGDQEYTISPA